MDSPQHLRGRVRFLAGMAACNLILPMLAFASGPGEGVLLLIAAFAGLIAGQMAALCVWFVWAAGGLWLRVVQLALAAILLATAALLGLWAGAGFDLGPTSREDFKAAATTGLMLPPIALAVQVPLWLCCLVFDWRIVPQHDVTPPPPLSIRDLLSGTALVALALGSMRLLLAATQRGTDLEFASGFWQAWAISAVILAGTSALLILPMVAILLRPEANETAARGGCAFAAGAVGLAWLTMLLLAAQIGAGGRGPEGIAFLFLAVLVLTALGTLLAPLWMARSQGYRLKIGRGE